MAARVNMAGLIRAQVAHNNIELESAIVHAIHNGNVTKLDQMVSPSSRISIASAIDASNIGLAVRVLNEGLQGRGCSPRLIALAEEVTHTVAMGIIQDALFPL